MSGTSVIKQVISVDVMNELLLFSEKVEKSQTSNIELVDNALHLLLNLPLSRDSVFDYFTSIYEKSLVKQLEYIEVECSSVRYNEDVFLIQVNQKLIFFINNNTNTWNLVISKWAIELLGKFTGKYSKRGWKPALGSLTDSLNQWVSCQSTRLLMDLFMSCIDNLNMTQSVVIYNLLDCCVVNRPSLDWAVARVACKYPYVLTKYVFTWGLQHFLMCDRSSNNVKTHCLSDILTHLSGCFSAEIQNVVINLIKWSIDDQSDYGKELSLDKGAVIPFVLHVSTLSQVLLNTLSHTPLEVFKFEALDKYVKLSDRWCKLVGSKQMLLEITAHFILSIEDSAQQVVSILMKSCKHNNPVIRSTVHEIIELMLKELDSSVLGCNSNSNEKISTPLLKGLLSKINWLITHLLSNDECIINLTTRLICLIGLEHPSVLSKTISYILMRCTDEDKLVSVVTLSTGYQTSSVLTPAISQCLSLHTTNDTINQQYIDPSVLWINISKLLKWEASGTLVSLGMQQAVRDNITAISERLSSVRDINIAHDIADVVKRALVEASVSNTKQMTVYQTLSLVQAAISYFYICLTHTDSAQEMKGIRLVRNIIRKLCLHDNTARTLVIRELLESCLFRSCNVLFGATREPTFSLPSSNVSLLEENHRQGTCSLLAQRHSVLHAGIIESYKRKYDSTNKLDPDRVAHSTRLLMSVLSAACSSDSEQGFIESIISVALLLVELISPDVMYNGLPWPEYEFCKVTVERDLFMRRLLDQVPLVWSLLSYIAYYRPALCYCSVILRALISTLISQWSLANQQGRKAGECKNLIEITNRVLGLMTLGQLLPPPLCYISDTLVSLEPSQIVEVLKQCVWNYLRFNVPSPALFTRDSNGTMWRDPSVNKPCKQYVEPLRLAILSNISKLGSLYNILFVPSEQ